MDKIYKMIELYYSNASGNAVFSKNPSDSRGGVITPSKIAGGINNLFGTISQKDLNYGQIDYRCIFLKNSSISKDIKNLKVWMAQTNAQRFYSYSPYYNASYSNSVFKAKMGGIVGWDASIYPLLYFKYNSNFCTIYSTPYDRSNDFNAIAGFETSLGVNQVIAYNNSNWSGYVTIQAISLENNEPFEVSKSDVTGNFDPFTMDPLPIAGESYIVPSNSVGAWAGYDGYVATWSGSTWSIKIDDFAEFSFGIEEIVNGTVQPTNDIFQQPFGVDFIKAKSIDEAFVVPLLEKASYVSLWIKRDTKKRIVSEKDFDQLGIEANHPITLEQEVSMYLDYTEMNSYKAVYQKETKFVKDTLLSLDFSVKVLELGEANYTNMGIAIRTKFLNDFDSSKVSIKVSFMSVVYDNVQNLDSFADFPTTGNFNQNLNLLVTFNESGTYELFFDLIDLANSHITNTNSFAFTVLDE